MNVPKELKYAASHEWLSVDNDIGIVGITDHAQQELSDVVYVQLPEIGRKVTAKEPTAVVESVKAASDIYSPVSGEVVEVNTTLENDPALINSEPYDKGWIFKIKLSQPEEANALMDAENYSNQIGS
jgi:glycine cleavage system H protein